MINFEYLHQVRATVCILDKSSTAYEAVALDKPEKPQALAIPLWPGDSAWSSLYEYYASLYRIRMVNGYSPIVKTAYHHDIFEKLQSVNQGVLDDAQIEQLLGMGVEHLILHENAFPEKVSPFPVGLTLQRLINHPRLELLKQDRSMYAFKILPTPRLVEFFSLNNAGYWPSARRYELDKTFLHGKAYVSYQDSANRGSYVRLSDRDASLQTKETLVAYLPNLQWEIRTRGTGSVYASSFDDVSQLRNSNLTLESRSWTWETIPVPAFEKPSHLSLKLEQARGGLDLDLAFLGCTPKDFLHQDTIFLPAASLFHAGYLEPETLHIVLDPDSESDEEVVYTHLPSLPSGNHKLELLATSPAEKNTLLGQLNIWQNQEQLASVPVFAGKENSILFGAASSTPLKIAFKYNRQDLVKIEGLKLTRP